MSRSEGKKYELMALKHLLNHGLTHLESNYLTQIGEIDLIMRDNTQLVFIEVRARKSTVFGGALESITRTKQNKLIKTALYYLNEKKIAEKQPTRFDVISIEGQPPTIEWIKNAFGIGF